MDTHFEFSLTKPQLVEIFKKHVRKTTKIVLATAIMLLFVFAFLLLIHFTVEDAHTSDLAEWFLILDLILWVSYIIIRCSASKNAERYFKYNSVNDAVAYCFDVTDVDFVVSQPALGNVWHYKYEMISRVIDLDGYVAVMLESNQFLPILVSDHTAPLINTLKSFAKIKK